MLTALDLSLGRILPSLAPPHAPTTASMPWPRALFMLGVTDAVESAPVPRVGGDSGKGRRLASVTSRRLDSGGSRGNSGTPAESRSGEGMGTADGGDTPSAPSEAFHLTAAAAMRHALCAAETETPPLHERIFATPTFEDLKPGRGFGCGSLVPSLICTPP
jgi:hypothetical protein